MEFRIRDVTTQIQTEAFVGQDEGGVVVEAFEEALCKKRSLNFYKLIEAFINDVSNIVIEINTSCCIFY